MSALNFLENEILKLRLGKPLSITLPITPWLMIFTVMPNEDGTGGVEVAGGGYNRVNVSSAFPTPNGTGLVANTSDINQGTSTASWGNAKGWGTNTAQTGTGIILEAHLFPGGGIDIPANQPVIWPAGALIFESE
ncbi:hypothetical protein GTQ99_00165 [Kineococcus sp. T13]|uniref:phage tail fiber protein n=1 Tax=Kineococcus vitellinus TaxID=2696565 RepID=UPI001412871B|nr:hypothetical protein [Kineococcus vitellinus]NAZ73844.1 hypothetical protein [Kineococcus vitellinus]